MNKLYPVILNQGKENTVKKNRMYYRDIIKFANIKLHRTVNQYYLWDVQKDEKRIIDQDLYEYIQNEQKEITSKIKVEIDQLYDDGYLHPNSIQKIECCIGDYEKAARVGISGMVFQVTQMCNFKCSYCPHAQENNERMRKHANIRMAKEMAFKGIDYLAEHSNKKRHLDISFFGGEPLIEFELIKEIVLYAEKKLYDKKLIFNICTNAFLLSEEKIDFFSRHNFNVSISMDGPEHIHNKNRKDWGGKGSFQKVYKNFLAIKKAFKYSKSKIMISAVLDKQCDLNEVEKFFEQKEFDNIIISPALVDDLSSTIHHSMTDNFYFKITYFKFLAMLSILRKIEDKDLPVTSKMLKNQLLDLYDEIRNVKHAMSPVFKYLFEDCGKSFSLYLNCQGNFYPAVGVNEEKTDMLIGNINDGIELDRIEKLLQKASAYKSDCINCPAVAYCRLGIICCVEEQGITENIKQEYCKNFIGLFQESVALSILEDEKEQYYGEFYGIEAVIGNEENIRQAIFRVIENVTLKRIKCTDKDVGVRLLSKEMGLSAIELLYVLFELEKIYHITFKAEDVLDYHFDSVQNIMSLILKKRYR